MRAVVLSTLFAIVFGLSACDTGETAKKDPTPTPTPTPPPTADTSSALKLGVPIDPAAQKVALSDVAKTPSAYVNKEFATTGTVTAVCQHMGCWMEIKDDQSEAHIRMAGHKFFVPKTASGKKARIMAKLVPSGNDGACGEGQGVVAHEARAPEDRAGHVEANGKGCRAEAEEQMGHPLAKLELEADGVELM